MIHVTELQVGRCGQPSQTIKVNIMVPFVKLGELKRYLKSKYGNEIYLTFSMSITMTSQRGILRLRTGQELTD